MNEDIESKVGLIVHSVGCYCSKITKQDQVFMLHPGHDVNLHSHLDKLLHIQASKCSGTNSLFVLMFRIVVK